jgi:cysteinyl-tRNA synthetase
MSARINDFKAGNVELSQVDKEGFERFKKTYIQFMEDVLGLKDEQDQNNDLLEGAIQVLIDIRKKVRADKNFALSDKIRDDLKAIGIQLKDNKDGSIDYEVT